MSERLRSRMNNPSEWDIDESEVGVHEDYGPATKYVLYPNGDDDRSRYEISIKVCKSMYETPGRDGEWYAHWRLGKDTGNIVKSDEDSAILTAADIANWFDLRAESGEEIPPEPKV